MNIFEYVPLMKTLDPVVGTVGIVLLLLFLVFITLKMLGGLRRGFWKQLFRTGTTLLSAVISYITGVSLSNSIIGSLNAESFGDVIDQIATADPEAANMVAEMIAKINFELIEYLVLLPATIVLIPLLTAVVFVVLNVVLNIVRAIVTKIVGVNKAKNNSDRLGGVVLAFVEAVIWVIMVTLPLSAMFSLANAVYEKATATPETGVYGVAQEEETEDSFVTLYQQYVAPFTQNPASAFIQQMGANAIADGIATVTIDDQPTNMREEVLKVADVVVEATKLAEADFTALTENEKDSITAIVFTLSESKIMSKVLVGTLNTIPTLVEEDVIPLDFDDTAVSGLIDSVMTFLEETSTETLEEDLGTLTEVYFGLCDSGIIAAVTNGEDVMDAFKEGKDELLDAINALSSNERTENIVDGMYDVVINAAFGNTSSKPEEGDEEAKPNIPGDNTGNNAGVSGIGVQDIKDGITQIADITKGNKTDDEYIAELADAIIDVAKDKLNVEIAEDMATEAAKFINENLSEEMDKLRAAVADKIKFNELVFALLDAFQCYNDGEEIDLEQFEEILDIEITDRIDELVPEE